MSITIANTNFNIDAETIVLNTFGEEAHFVLNSVLLYTYGLEQSFFLTYLMGQYKYHKKEEKLRNDKSFYLTNQKISLYTTISEYKIQNLKKFAIETNLIRVTQEGMPSKTYYYLNFDKILEVAMTNKTLSELAYLYAYEYNLTEEKTEFDIPLNNIEDIDLLKKETVKFLRLFCKQKGISYTGKDKKKDLIQKIIGHKNPNLLNSEKLLEDPFFSVDEKFDHQLMKNSTTSRCEIQPLPKNEELSLHSSSKIQPLVDEKTVTNQDINKQDINNNHDHEERDFLEIDFEKILHSLGVNFTSTNRESINSLLQKMKPHEVEKYLRQLHQSILESPNIKNVEALFSTKLKRQECQVISDSRITSTKVEKKGTPKHYTKADIKNYLLKCNVVEQKRLFELAKKEFFRKYPEDNGWLLEYIDDDFLGEPSLIHLQREWIKVLFPPQESLEAI